MGHVVIRNLCKDYVERRRRPRLLGGSENGMGTARRILQNVNLDLHPGQLVCILGASGCGKSTLLRIIAGFEDHTSGEVEIDGRPVQGPSTEHVFVFQHSGLLPWMTVHQNVALGVRRMEDTARMHAKVQECIELVNLAGFEHHYPRQLSGGMQRRAELARAMAVNPQILFMDEPFTGLDFLTRLRLREEIVNMHQLLRKTILFVTHDIDEALIMGDRIVVLGESPACILLDAPVLAQHPRDFASNPELSALRKNLYRTLGVHDAL